MANDNKYKQLKQISTAALLEESTHMELFMRSLIVVACVFMGFIIWAAFVQISEKAVTVGEIMPEGKVQVVQHLEGGIVEKVLVKNGQEVKKGQLLVELDPTAKRAELSQLYGREITLILNINRANAYLQNKQPDAEQWSKEVINSEYNTIQEKSQISGLIKAELSQLQTQRQYRTDQVNVLKSALAQQKEQLNEARTQRKVWQKHIKLLTKEFDMYEKLRNKNLISHKDYLIVLRDMNKAKGELVRINSQIEQIKEMITGTHSKLQELGTKLTDEAKKELGEANDNLVEVRHQIDRIQEQFNRLSVRATVTGIVKGLRVFPGNVIKPGDAMLELVPLNEKMIVESRVDPKDIGHIKIGDHVEVKVLTYDYARYGSIKGKLQELSAYTFTDKDDKPYYKATISLDKQYIGLKGAEKKLRPGMTVEADIVTGKKSLLQYMLKPIHQSASRAFHER